jgi:homocysteine S-methyltransferase
MKGEEFTGAYSLSEQEFVDWHRWMVTAIASAEPDVITFETFPRLDECKAVCKLLREEFPDVVADFSFCVTRGDGTIACGDRIEDVAKFLDT